MALSAAVVALTVASVCPPSLAHPAWSWGASNYFHQYTIALGESVTVQSPGFPTSVPPSSEYGWNVLCLPSKSTALLISCDVNLEDTPLCYPSSLTIKTDDEDRRLCGKEHVKDFISSSGFVRFEFASESKVIGQGFICEAKCQAPEEEADIVSPPTPGTEANLSIGTLEGEEEGSLELETVTDGGAEDLTTVNDHANDLETVTDDVEDLESETDDTEDQESVTDDAENLETLTNFAETEIENPEDLETETDDALDLESEADDSEDLGSLPVGAEDLETVTDFAKDLETETDDAEVLETVKKGADPKEL